MLTGSSLRQTCGRLLRALTSLLSQEWLHWIWVALRVLGQYRPARPDGLYEILDYEATLELLDVKGHQARLSKRQRVKFLQDHVLAFQDYAWGDGNTLEDYRCTPGVVADQYREGDRWNILISLREEKSRGDVVDFHMARKAVNAFLGEEEWQQVEIRHPTRRLRLATLFPSARPCQRAVLQTRSRKQSQVLGPEHFSTLPDGCQQVAWETRQARALEIYTLRWTW